MSGDRSYFPICFDVTDRICLVAGGGTVALRKARALADAGAAVRVVAPAVLAEFRDLSRCELREAPYEAAALEGAALAFAATDSAEVNRRVAADCRDRGVPCNVVDVPEQCDFIMPAVVRRGRLSIAVSTGGASPRAAGRIRRRLEELFGPAHARWLEALARARDLVRQQVPEEARRKEVLSRLAEEDVLRAAEQGDRALGARVRTILEAAGVRGPDSAEPASPAEGEPR